jgi:hypothetical protein
MMYILTFSGFNKLWFTYITAHLLKTVLVQPPKTNMDFLDHPSNFQPFKQFNSFTYSFIDCVSVTLVFHLLYNIYTYIFNATIN